MPSLPSGFLGDLDPTSDRAVFRQIADQLREAIDRGRFKEGEKLPSEAELVDHYGVRAPAFARIAPAWAG
ncbi:GntR family transcriptional regulator, partial [Streptomyces scabiei]|uniref:GntR family transcriptional regulator n=1 Tax=Streptomyces scabiei TaxID=1930 RepID=UPI0006290A82